MAKLSATTTVTQTLEVKLKPSTKQLLLNELKAYQQTHTEAKRLKELADAHLANIRSIREDTGEEVLSLEGYTVRNVPGTVSYLDKQLFVELGGSLEQLANATRSKPKKAYERVVCPGEKEVTYAD